MQLKIFECGMFGECTIGKQHFGNKCCKTCDRFQASDAPPRDGNPWVERDLIVVGQPTDDLGLPPIVSPVRNLYMHIYPKAGPSDGNCWRWTIQQAVDRWDLFNGRKIVGVATGPETESFEAVVDEFDGLDIDFIHVTNDRTLREVATFKPALKLLMEDPSPDEITFVSHSKGVTHTGNHAIKWWAEVAWQICCDYPDVIESVLSQCPIVGPWKKKGGFSLPDKWNWHYSGSFYWFRNLAVSRRGYAVQPVWYGIESWTGRNFEWGEAGALLLDGGLEVNLYSERYWSETVRPLVEQWKKDHGDSHKQAVPVGADSTHG